MADQQDKNIMIPDKLVAKLEARASDVVRFDDLQDALFFTRQFWPAVEKDQSLIDDDPKAYKRLERLAELNQVVALPALNDKQVVSIFEKGIGRYFLEMIEDIELWDKVRGFLLTIFDFEQRDQIKSGIRQALLRNKEIITTAKIKRNDKEYSPTIGQWLLDYTSVVGNTPVSVVELNEYFSTSKNYRGLPDEDKNRVRTLISLYERLKKSSQTPEGLEETIFIQDGDEKGIFVEGRVEDYDPRIKKILKEYKESGELSTETEIEESPAISTGPEQEIVSAYQGRPEQQQAIIREQERINKKIGVNPNRLRDTFYKSVQAKNVNQTIAVLKLMASQGQVTDFLQTEEKLVKFLTSTWEKQYGKDLVSEFQVNPTQPKFVRLFLRYVLEERLAVSTSDAARVGMQVGNILVNNGKKDYNKMAYFDLPTKSFKWFEE